MKSRIFGAALITAALAAGPAFAQSAEDFFKGKTMTYIVATSAGGGYDKYGRLVGKYLTKHLGLDKVVVRNMPGAGHIIGANFLYAAKPDGLTVGTFNTGLIYAQLVNREGVQFDLTKMSWVGKAAADTRTLVVGDHTEFMNFDDLRKSDRSVKLAVSGVGSASYTETRLMARAFNLNLDVIPGFSGTEDTLAIMREEVDGTFASMSSYASFIAEGEGRFLIGVGGEAKDGVPQARDLVEDEVGEALVAVIESQATLARLTASPPGVPQDRLAVLRKAYLAALSDPELLVDAEKLGIPIVPLGGDAVQAAVSAALDRSPEIKAMIAKLLEVDIPSETVKISLTGIEKEGRQIIFQNAGAEVTVKISGSRTKLMIGGAEGKRKNLVVGMNCTVTYAKDGDKEASLVDCAN